MTMLEQAMLDVDGAALEVGFAGVGEPVICQSHPFVARTPDYDPANGWERGMGRLVAINPRGVGRSSGQLPRDFTFRQHGDDLEVVRRRLGVDRWVFWGESGGASVALLYALAYPQSLAGVIVAYVGPSGRRIVEDGRSDLSPHHPAYHQTLTNSSPLARHPAVLSSLRPELASAEWVQWREDLWVLSEDGRPVAVCPSGDERWHAAWEEFVTVFEVQDRLGEIQVPTLVVAGRLDPFFPVAHCELLRSGIPNAEFVVLEETGHGVVPQSSDLAKYRDAVRKFLARIAT